VIDDEHRAMPDYMLVEARLIRPDAAAASDFMPPCSIYRLMLRNERHRLPKLFSRQRPTLRHLYAAIASFSLVSAVLPKVTPDVILMRHVAAFTNTHSFAITMPFPAAEI